MKSGERERERITELAASHVFYVFDVDYCALCGKRFILLFMT